MSHRFFKMLAVALVSFPLSYYSVAWAMMQCIHEEDLVQSVSHESPRLDNNRAYREMASGHSAAEIECPGSLLHLETMAEESVRSHSVNLNVVTDLDFEGPLSPPSPTVSGEALVWLRNVFDGCQTGMPRYLCFSNLRI